MSFYHRACLYLFRKRSKTVLLFLILLLVNSMILGTVMILHAAQTTKVSMQEKSKAKAVCEITQDTYQLSSQDISAAAQLPQSMVFPSEIGFVWKMSMEKPFPQPSVACFFPEMNTNRTILWIPCTVSKIRFLSMPNPI